MKDKKSPKRSSQTSHNMKEARGFLALLQMNLFKRDTPWVAQIYRIFSCSVLGKYAQYEL